MALSVKQLNADASFLLSFEPLTSSPNPHDQTEPFRILLDPWITGPSKIFHSKFSMTTRREAACITSLQALPEPDLVIISQHKSDHCNEATLRQLPPSGAKTLILAEPASAKLIRSWKYFEKGKVRTIPRWEHPRTSRKETVLRIPIPPRVYGGEYGEVTVAFIPQKRDLNGLHAAIGITYRPPSSVSRIISDVFMTPPATPESPSRSSFVHSSPSGMSAASVRPLLTPTTPLSSLGTPSLPSLRSLPSAQSLSPYARERAVSVIFSPHGISYPSLAPYASSHLMAEAALPLTALLHCFDAITNPWWLGGNISAGMPVGQETACALSAKAWISAHDGDKDVQGIISRILKTRKYHPDEIIQVVKPAYTTCTRERASAARVKGTEVLAMKVGEELMMTSEGVWDLACDTCVWEKSTAPTLQLAFCCDDDGKAEDSDILEEVMLAGESIYRTGLLPPWQDKLCHTDNRANGLWITS